MRLLLLALAARAQTLPPPRCSRDTKLAEPWAALAPEPLAWSEATLARVAAFLEADRAPALELPKVYVYPFPAAFENASNIWAAAGLDAKGAAAYFGRPHAFPGSYFQMAYGAKGPAAAVSAWTRRKGELHWTPDMKLLVEEVVPGAVGGESCRYLRQPSQHLTGLVVHRGLRTAYPGLVDDPEEADLFFVPDHATRSVAKTKAGAAAKAALCEAEGQLWLAHLRALRSKSGTSFLERRRGRDHFFARNRAWHYASPRTPAEDRAAAAAREEQGDCCPWSHARPETRDAQRLWIETQAPFQRSAARHRPVPYLPPLAPKMTDDQPARCSFRGTSEARREFVAALFVGGTSGGFNDEERGRNGSRRAFARSCDAMGSKCVSKRPPGPDGGKPVITYSEMYARSDFCVQPPGHSAARKGIVDSLVAGCVPVLLAADARPGTPSPWDQRDLWPWHWPWQGASSVTVAAADLRGPGGLAGLLATISNRQLALMRRVMREHARELLWPLGKEDASTKVDALKVAMHHLWALAKGDGEGCE